MRKRIVLRDTAESSPHKAVDAVVEMASPSSLYVTVVDKRGNDHFTVMVDLFDGKLRAAVWQPGEQGNDPGVVVVCDDMDSL